jgi:hypothetical protein
MMKAAEYEAIAVELKRKGYNGGIVSRRMIEEHGMPEEEAVALVGRLFGKEVDPRAGETTSALIIGLAEIALGVAGFVCFFLIVGGRRSSVIVYVALLGFIGKGIADVIKALVNSGVKEELRDDG